MSSDKPVLYVRFNRCGMCNKLITWAKAYVWSQKNNADLDIAGWVHIPFGSIRRWDRSWRWYVGHFKRKTRLFSGIRNDLPLIREISDPMVEGARKMRFKSTPHVFDLIELSAYREMIVPGFYDLIRPRHLELARQAEIPDIGVHVRRGDYIGLKDALDFSYYLAQIRMIRKIAGKQLKVFLFTDGYKNELQPLLEEPDVHFFQPVNDLVDLLVLSSSKVIITTKASTYSYWAAFISNAIVLHHPKTNVPQCRPAGFNKTHFEGAVDPDKPLPDQLIHELESLA